MTIISKYRIKFPWEWMEFSKFWLVLSTTEKSETWSEVRFVVLWSIVSEVRSHPATLIGMRAASRGTLVLLCLPPRPRLQPVSWQVLAPPGAGPQS